MKNKYIRFVLMISLAILPVLASASPADIDLSGQISTCPSLQNDLRYQSRDSFTNGEVSSLQDFLQSKGYLNSEPTGYFGLLTLQATKNFQSANGISPTGYVGSITRAKIASIANCEVSVNKSTATPSTASVQKTEKDPVIKSVGSSANTTNSFYPGDKVTIVGSLLPSSAYVYIGSTTVQAQGNAEGYNITFYAPSTLSSGTYNLYIVGKATQSNAIQVNVMAKTINQGQPHINYISPSSVIADGKTTVTIFGSNLNSTSVYMVGKAADLEIAPGSITYDTYGTYISFVIPAGTTATTYDVAVRGKASESNRAKLTITSSQKQNYKPTVTMVQGKASNNFEAYIGEDLSIEGSYLAGNITGTTTVYLGEMKAIVKKVSDNAILIVTPNLSSGTYDLTVSNDKGISSPVKVIVKGKQTSIPNVSYVQTSAEQKNIIHTDQRATVYGSNFSGTVYVKLVGKAQDYRVKAYNVYSGSADFTVPVVASTGEFDIYVEQSNTTSNPIKIQIIK